MTAKGSVHKFGGTSLADARGYRRAADLVWRPAGSAPCFVVVSAMAGVTDGLIRLVGRASSRDAGYRADLDGLRDRQIAVAAELLPADRHRVLSDALRAEAEDIRDVLRALWLMRSPPKNALDLIAGYGELWSARLLAELLQTRGAATEWLDARAVLVVEPGETSVVVDWARSREKLAAWRREHLAESLVVTGFVAATPDGVPTTLGRNGSDFSASIFAALLEATDITIWTDVDGVLSADPAEVPEAVVLDALSYDEAMELAYFGAKVIHPGTMGPAVEHGIPIVIRNTFRPEAPGTRIHLSRGTDSAVKGFATVRGLSLINLEGTGMVGVPGVAERLFGSLSEAGVSVVLISQGSSEHSICFAVPRAQAGVARQALERAFHFEQTHGLVQRIDVKDGCTILAAVGDGMAGIPGVAANFFGALAKAGVNVRAIAQGSSERNISVVLDDADATRALRAAHAGFYLSKQALSIGIIGPGGVGGTLLAQFAAEQQRLREMLRVDLRVRGIATRTHMLLDERRLALESWREDLATSEVPSDLDRLADHVRTASIPHALLIDCSASAEVASRYADWLERGIHVITPNKQAGTGALEYYDRLRGPGNRTRAHWLYETTVGAALPILHTLRDLIETGDEIQEIEGILSGTLSYIFNSFDGSRPFSHIVREARELGYTEPDPREDLSGMDVARKVVILAREMGLRLELRDVEVESLVPADMASGSVARFLAGAEGLDGTMQRRVERAAAKDEVLRFVGTIDPALGCAARLRTYPRAHPFARIRLTDNIVQFRTRRYRENPLVVQGPGAGREVTAAGLFADVLRLASYLGA